MGEPLVVDADAIRRLLYREYDFDVERNTLMTTYRTVSLARVVIACDGGGHELVALECKKASWNASIDGRFLMLAFHLS